MSEQLRCPQCGATDCIDILVAAWARLRQDAADDLQTILDAAGARDLAWDDESAAVCRACGFTGKVLNFDPEGAETAPAGGSAQTDESDDAEDDDPEDFCPPQLCAECDRLVPWGDGAGPWHAPHCSQHVAERQTSEPARPPYQGPPWACECDDPHPAAGAVCRYCQEVLGRHQPGDPMPRRIVAQLYPQAWINGQATDVGAPIDFDVTDQVLALGQEEALALRDNREASDALIPEGLRQWHRQRYGAESCYWVSVADAIADYFASAPEE